MATVFVCVCVFILGNEQNEYGKTAIYTHLYVYTYIYTHTGYCRLHEDPILIRFIHLVTCVCGTILKKKKKLNFIALGWPRIEGRLIRNQKKYMYVCMSI